MSRPRVPTNRLPWTECGLGVLLGTLLLVIAREAWALTAATAVDAPRDVLLPFWALVLVVGLFGTGLVLRPWLSRAGRTR